MMKIISSLCAITLALVATVATPAQAQTGETPLKQAEVVRITITGVPATDQQSMALQQPITISNEGTIRVQHLKSEVRASGMTPTALARSLESIYKSSKIYTNPVINISRDSTGTSVQTVTVSGNVRLPGSAIFRPGMLINDAISEKGGPDDFANMKQVRLIRAGKTRELDLSSISKNPAVNIPLQPGDTIMVQAAGFFNKNR